MFGVGALQHKHTHTVYVVPLGVLNGFQASQEAFRSQEESRSEAGARKGRKVAKQRVFSMVLCLFLKVYLEVKLRGFLNVFG